MATPSDSNPSAARAERALVVGVVVNGLLALGKTLGGLISGSPSLLADGYHSLGDLGTGGLAWLTWRWAQRPPDEDHHYGHGKIEAAAAWVVGLVLLGTGVFVIVEASHGEQPHYEGNRAWIALGVALVSMAANEWLTRLTLNAARETSSQTLAALAADNRSDMLTSVLVIVGVLGSMTGVTWLEVILTGVIGLFVSWMGLETSKRAFDTLTDRVPDVALRGRVTQLASGIDGVAGVQHVAVHPLGAAVRVDMEVSVSGNLTVIEGHAIAHAVEEAVVAAEESVAAVAVHVNPAGVAHPHVDPVVHG